MFNLYNYHDPAATAIESELEVDKVKKRDSLRRKKKGRTSTKPSYYSAYYQEQLPVETISPYRNHIDYYQLYTPQASHSIPTSTLNARISGFGAQSPAGDYLYLPNRSSHYRSHSCPLQSTYDGVCQGSTPLMSRANVMTPAVGGLPNIASAYAASYVPPRSLNQPSVQAYPFTRYTEPSYQTPTSYPTSPSYVPMSQYPAIRQFTPTFNRTSSVSIPPAARISTLSPLSTTGGSHPIYKPTSNLTSPNFSPSLVSPQSTLIPASHYRGYHGTPSSTVGHSRNMSRYHDNKFSLGDQTGYTPPAAPYLNSTSTHYVTPQYSKSNYNISRPIGASYQSAYVSVRGGHQRSGSADIGAYLEPSPLAP
eukprot:GHVH01007059.1.p1 GENE.GHVH01007059.1~~GHVH01007059.1.p1  ORF type:complete len:365 (-),score=11.45 GHVH01007059.1:184-1278(-)